MLVGALGPRVEGPSLEAPKTSMEMEIGRGSPFLLIMGSGEHRTIVWSIGSQLISLYIQ